VATYLSPIDLAKTGFTCLIDSAIGGVYAHVHGGGTANGTNITIWHYVKQPNLEWTIKPAEENGFYYIVSSVDRTTDRVLHQHGGNNDNDGNVTLWQRVHQGNTQVRFQEVDSGFYNIIFRHSGKGVHVHGGGSANDTNISQWEVVNQNNLKWRFALAPKTFTDFVDKPVPFMLESGVNGWFAHVHGGGTANGTNISVWSFVDQDNLKWFLKTSETSGYYYIVTAIDKTHDHVLHQYGATQDNGGNVTLWDRVNQGNTQVRFEDAGDGYFRIPFRHSNKCVHLHGGVGYNDANITQWEPVNQKNLVWRFAELRP